MPNDYFGYTALVERSLARSTLINAVFAALESAFDKLPSLARLKWNYATHATVVGGTANAIELTLSQPISAYTDGMRISFTATYSVTGAATVDVDGQGPVSITRYDGTSLQEGDIVAESIPTIVCVGGARFQLDGLTGPAGAAGDVTGSGSSTDNALARFSGALGNIIQNSGWTLADTETMTAGGTLNMNGNQIASHITQYKNATSTSSGTSTLTIAKTSLDLTPITATGNFTINVTAPDSGFSMPKRVRVTMDGTGARDITIQRQAGSSNIYFPQNTSDTTVALDTTVYGAGAIFDIWLEDDGSFLVVHWELIKAGS